MDIGKLVSSDGSYPSNKDTELLETPKAQLTTIQFCMNVAKAEKIIEMV
jgi:hypothetical protein